MRRLLSLFVFVFLVGCASHDHSGLNPSEEPPELILAESATEQQDWSAIVKTDLSQQLKVEEEHWRSELERLLQGAELEGALLELQDFIQRMAQVSEDLSSQASFNERISAIYVKVFTPEELENLAKLLSSPEWKKYLALMEQLNKSPDALGLRADFTKALERERDLMGAKIFGESAAGSAAGDSP